MYVGKIFSAALIGAALLFGQAQAASVVTGQPVSPVNNAIQVSPAQTTIIISFSTVEGAGSFSFDFEALLADFTYPVAANLSAQIFLSVDSATGRGANSIQVSLGSAGPLNITDAVGNLIAAPGATLNQIVLGGTETTLNITFAGASTISPTGLTIFLTGTPTLIPLPASALLLVSGIGGLGFLRARRKALAA